MNSSRREFLADVGKGALAASLGPALVADLGLGLAHAAEERKPLGFGKLEPLVCLLQETPPNKLVPTIVEKIQRGTDSQELVAAAALANARTFGGEDYVGFHTMMALAPAFHMARELPREKQALPILKVLYRNTNRIQEFGGRKNEVLHADFLPVHVAFPPERQLVSAVRAKKVDEAEGVLAVAGRSDAQHVLDTVLHAVEDATEVHRVVLPYRAWDLLPVIGREHALTLLRQSVRYCVKAESESYIRHCGGARELLPKLIQKYKLEDPRSALGSRKAAPRKVDDAWVENMSLTIFKSSPEEAAGAAAEALGQGIDPAAIGEAISLAANQLILRDEGRPKAQSQANKPVGSVHGDSIGVHGCDSANAWRNLARVGTGRHVAACLILGAYQVALDRIQRGGDFLKWEPYPRAEMREKVRNVARDALLRETEGAIREKDQARAAALIHRYGELALPPRPAFDLLLRYSVSEDGALHAEKYYRTVVEEYNSTRQAFRWRQLIGLARVTASSYGQPAPGYAEACQLLKV